MSEAVSSPALRTLALLGRPNAGKSTIFNLLTGGDARVGNFPGITVDLLTAQVATPGGSAELVDLPGLYSLELPEGAQSDESVTRDWLLEPAHREHTGLLQVLDVTQLALGLRLTRELLALPQPLLVVLTQCDLLRSEGRRVDTEALGSALGATVLAVDGRDPACRAQLLESLGAFVQSPPTSKTPATAWEPEALARTVLQPTHAPSARSASLAERTDRLDRYLLHPWLGPVLFLALMTLLFAAVFLVADPVTNLLDALTRRAGVALTRYTGQGMLRSFLVDGVLGGAGTVLAFLPQIVILSFAMELLDASGYLARGVFLIDRALRTVGLGGRAFVPLLTAHACAVPAISATRILRDPRERLTAMLVLPLMTCSARIPTYGLLLNAFFSHRSPLFRAGLFVLLYALGVLAGLVAARLLRRTFTRGRALPLVLEMPAYRRPDRRTVLRTVRRTAGRFVSEVGTTILAVSVVLWALLTVPAPGQHAAADPTDRTAVLERSVGASLGRALEPVTRVAGFDWRMNVGLVASFGARELMVGTLGIIFGLEDAAENPGPLGQRIRAARAPNGRPLYGVPNALALLAFFVLACQCMSTVAAVRRETRSWRWPAFLLLYTYSAAFVAAVAVYQLARAALGA